MSTPTAQAAASALYSLRSGKAAGASQAKAMSKSKGKRLRVKRGAAPNPNAPLGQGGRFAALKQKLAGRPGVTNPGALAAAIGRKKYGASRFGAMAAAGR